MSASRMMRATTHGWVDCGPRKVTHLHASPTLDGKRRGRATGQPITAVPMMAGTKDELRGRRTARFTPTAWAAAVATAESNGNYRIRALTEEVTGAGIDVLAHRLHARHFWTQEMAGVSWKDAWLDYLERLVSNL